MIGLINYGSGNYKSVYNALEYLNIDFVGIDHPDQLTSVSHIVLPGVGAFKAMYDQLQTQGYVDSLHREVIDSGKLFLGICVGMQILATLGTEFEDTAGLDFIPGRVERIDAKQHDLPVPHIGWNEVALTRPSSLFKEIEKEAIFYFVHSYHFVPQNTDHLASTCAYGSQLTASVEKDNIYGVQFHPEKSQLNGLQLLKNFASLS